MTLEELISEVNRRGLRVNNLFQVNKITWQANITDGERFWEFGKGDTPNAALTSALHKADHTEPVMGKKQQNLPYNQPQMKPNVASVAELEGLI